jgi:hypothetical protein
VVVIDGRPGVALRRPLMLRRSDGVNDKGILDVGIESLQVSIAGG